MAITYNADVTPETVFTTTGGGTVFSANRSSTTAYDLFADNAVVNDAIYVGRYYPFKGIKFNIGTALAATSITLAFEYWNGTAWTAITGLTDNTVNLTVTGQNWIDFDPNQMPNWAGNTVNSAARFWVRIRITAVTGITEGGANATSVAKVGNFAITVTGYTAGVPCTLTDIYNADVAGGWGQVTNLDRIYRFMCNLIIGDGTATYLKDLNKIIIIGSSVYWRDMMSLASSDIQLGAPGTGLPNYRTLDSCILVMYGGNTTYKTLLGAFRMYGGIIDGGDNSNYCFDFSNQTAGAQVLHNVILKVKRIILRGGIETRRVTVQYGVGIYIFTNASAIFDDFKVTTCAINTDPGYNPTMTNPIFNNASWLTIYGGTTPVYGTELNMVNAQYYNFDSPNNSITNNNFRQIVADKNTIDISVVDEGGSPIQNATVKVERYDGSEWCSEQITDSTATNSAVLDYLVSWGNTTLSVSDGTKFSIGDYIKIFTEWYKVTNIVSNTLTIERAKYGTFIMNIASTGNRIYKQALSVLTDANGAIPQVTALKRQRLIFGSSSPAPYNDATWRTVQNDQYRITISKDGYKTYQSVFTLSGQVIGQITLSTVKNINQSKLVRMFV